MSFDSTTSVDQNPPTAPGSTPASATWQFKDGTPQATGAKVTHVFNQPGTFVGDLRVRDRAGNLSDIRQFAVTVNPGPGGSSVGTLRGITGTAAFNLDRLRVSARYVRSRLKGSIILSGSAAQAGALRAELRRSAARPAARQDRGQAAQGRGVHEDPQAAGEPAAGHLPARLRRPRRDAADDPDAQGAARGRHPQRADQRRGGPVPLRGPAREGPARQAHRRLVAGIPEPRHRAGGRRARRSARRCPAARRSAAAGSAPCSGPAAPSWAPRRPGGASDPAAGVAPPTAAP